MVVTVAVILRLQIVNQNPELFDSDLEAEFLEDWDPEEEENERSREVNFETIY